MVKYMYERTKRERKKERCALCILCYKKKRYKRTIFLCVSLLFYGVVVVNRLPLSFMKMVIIELSLLTKTYLDSIQFTSNMIYLQKTSRRITNFLYYPSMMKPFKSSDRVSTLIISHTFLYVVIITSSSQDGFSTLEKDNFSSLTN